MKPKQKLILVSFTKDTQWLAERIEHMAAAKEIPKSRVMRELMIAGLNLGEAFKAPSNAELLNIKV